MTGRKPRERQGQQNGAIAPQGSTAPVPAPSGPAGAVSHLLQPWQEPSPPAQGPAQATGWAAPAPAPVRPWLLLGAQRLRRVPSGVTHPGDTPSPSGLEREQFTMG